MAGRWLSYDEAIRILGSSKLLRDYVVEWGAKGWLNRYQFEPYFVRTLFDARDELVQQLGCCSQKMLRRAMFRRRNVLRLAVRMATAALAGEGSDAAA